MSNFSLDFSRPWFLLLLIPAAVLTLVPYFRISRKYRKTRNRIISITLHILIMVMSISLLSGMTFIRKEINKTNEIILLVDMSYSSKASERQRNEFVKTVIDESKQEYKLGIMTFAYGDVQYPVPLSNDTSTMYQRFLNAPPPDERGTNIALALETALTKFENPSAGKIVLLTDGLETDGNVMSTIKNIAANVRVDIMYIPNTYSSDIQIMDIVLPDYNVVENEEIKISVNIQSSYQGDATIRLFDNESLSIDRVEKIEHGLQTITFYHAFETGKLHSLRVEIEANGDTLEENSSYCTFIYLATYDRILVLERMSGSMDTYNLDLILKDKYGVDYNDKVLISPLSDAKDMTIDELREWDEVVLVNISNSDLQSMAAGFDMLLNTYVGEYGGGLLTIGGDITVGGESKSNTYQRDDMIGTLYQSMLPVQAVNYTPPIAVMIVLDTSSSMTAKTPSGQTLMELAKDGAITCINALDERNYAGVVTFSDKYNIEIGVTPLTQKRVLIDTISRISPNGGTVYIPAIEAASQQLQAMGDLVELKHIIFVTDGEPSEIRAPNTLYETIRHYYENAGIRMSVLAINPSLAGGELCANMARYGGNGGYSQVSGASGDLSEIPGMMRDFLAAPEIVEMNYGEYTPKKNKPDSSIFREIGETEELPSLYGFYGTRLKSDAENIISGNYGVPIYAQRKHGNGKVGSIMCELSGSAGSWSRDFMQEVTGRKIVWNIIWALFPSEDIRVKDIRSKIQSQNFTTTIDIITTRETGDKIHVMVSKEGSNENSKSYLAEGTNEFSRCSFNIYDAGVYRIFVQKEVNGVYQEGYEYFTSFSYSQEYNVFINEIQQRTYMEELAANAKSEKLLTEPEEVFKQFDMEKISVYNPLIPFAILCILMFLLDIAVRKFKFKWPHEIIRDRKLKNELSQSK